GGVVDDRIGDAVAGHLCVIRRPAQLGADPRRLLSPPSQFGAGQRPALLRPPMKEKREVGGQFSPVCGPRFVKRDKKSDASSTWVMRIFSMTPRGTPETCDTSAI